MTPLIDKLKDSVVKFSKTHYILEKMNRCITDEIL